MLAYRLVQLIEDHAEELTEGLINDLRSNPRTPHYHHLTRDESHFRAYTVYRNLGHWITQQSEVSIASIYGNLAKRQHAEGIPLDEVVFALMATKNHLYTFVRTSGLVDSAMELHQERELRRLIGHFFDEAILYTVKAYESESSLNQGRDKDKAAA